MSFYDVGNRDIMWQDMQGGFYIRHVQALTAEALHSKSDIAAELAQRDIEIRDLRAELTEWHREFCGCKEGFEDHASWGSRPIATQSETEGQ